MICLIQHLEPQNPEFRINPENFHPCNNISISTFNILFFLSWPTIVIALFAKQM